MARAGTGTGAATGADVVAYDELVEDQASFFDLADDGDVTAAYVPYARPAVAWGLRKQARTVLAAVLLLPLRALIFVAVVIAWLLALSCAVTGQSTLVIPFLSGATLICLGVRVERRSLTRSELLLRLRRADSGETSADDAGAAAIAADSLREENDEPLSSLVARLAHTLDDSTHAGTSPFPIVCNHISYVEILALLAAHCVAFVVKAGLEKVPIVGQATIRLGCVFIGSKNGSNTRGGIAAALSRRITRRRDAVASGSIVPGDLHKRNSSTNDTDKSKAPRNIVVFAEGTTTNGSSILTMRRGAFVPGLPVNLKATFCDDAPTCGFSLSWESIRFREHLLSCMLALPRYRLVLIDLPTYHPSPEERLDPSVYARNVGRVLGLALSLPDSVALNREDKTAYHEYLLGLSTVAKALAHLAIVPAPIPPPALHKRIAPPSAFARALGRAVHQIAVAQSKGIAVDLGRRFAAPSVAFAAELLREAADVSRAAMPRRCTCTERLLAYPDDGALKRLGETLWNWANQKKFPLPWPDMPPLCEVADVRDYLETLTPLVVAAGYMDNTASFEAALRVFVARLGSQGLMHVLGARWTAGSLLSVLMPARRSLIESFERPHRPQKSGVVELSVGARALAKHSGRSSSGWWGSVRGGVTDQNAYALDKLCRDILDDAVWRNAHQLPHGVRAFEVRCSGGYGARWTQEHSTGGKIRFRGFLEPPAADGHDKGWKH